ncbi:signal peptidase I [Mumia flava]|uniref:Signal peptidase I n=1 Tax=Mumia flava TaxID=1348852 RepID=A0A0B2BGZ2_9ACTN|nr:signal peptidase I [Mumia flava]PJJ56320.1 signal peptidase I [Mumia flava]
MHANDTSAETRHEPSSGGRRGRKPLPLWQETILLAVLALVLAIVVKTFFVQAFYIPSGSMEQTLQVNDRILVQKVSYWTGEPQRGDVVVFDDPGGWLGPGAEEPLGPVQRVLSVFGLYPTGGHLVKRVIGVGGDRVRCCNTDGQLVINGVAIDEPYVANPAATAAQPFDIRVPEGRVWLMGDNRNNSQDSRAHMGEPGGGFVPVDDVLGKAWVIVWPWDRTGSAGSDSEPFADVGTPE